MESCNTLDYVITMADALQKALHIACMIHKVLGDLHNHYASIWGALCCHLSSYKQK